MNRSNPDHEPKDGISRRNFIASSAAAMAGGSLLVEGRSAAAQASSNKRTSVAASNGGDGARMTSDPLPPGRPGRDYTPVITPNNISLPWKIVEGVKVYHLIAQEVFHEFTPGLKAHCWGYNGHVHGPTIEAVEGDRVRIYVTNQLPAVTTVHWHGLLVPNGMDGVSGVTQPAIEPGQTFRYEFTLRQHGTYMYHSHHDTMTQEGMGLTGMFVVHPRPDYSEHHNHGVPIPPRPDRDFVILLHEWRVEPGTYRPIPFEMTDFNVLTMNARCFPGTAPLAVRRGQRVRIRFGNLSAMDHHPIHLHGYQYHIVATDGGDIVPASARPETTTLVGVGQTRDIQFVADAPGDWVMHCHMSHHIMNQMGHDHPNMIGVDAKGFNQQVRQLLPRYMTMGEAGMERHMMKMSRPANTVPMGGGPGPHGPITMAGMFTILKVREQIRDSMLATNEDPGWYQAPRGTRVEPASPEDLQRDGIHTVPA